MSLSPACMEDDRPGRMISEKCSHPSGAFEEFKKEEVEQSITDRFQKIVARNPDHVAVKIEDHTVTYGQLDTTANRIARAILANRDPGNEPIALLFEQAIDLIAAMLGVLTAGKFFVILDRKSPLERNNSILEDAGSRLLLTDGRNNDGTGLRPASLEAIRIDSLPAPASAADFGLTISPDAIASLIYTSGSSGKPKGVVQDHRNLLHASMRRINAFRICSEDRMTLLSSASNQAVMNILSALLSGARLCPFDVKQEGAHRLSAWLSREGITIYHSSASLFRQFVSTLLGNEDLSSIRLIRSASEAVAKGEVELYRRHFSPGCVFANGLSTTETGTSTLCFIGKDTKVTTATVPVGYPLTDMEILLLDEDGNRVDFGRVGEIAVRSEYLAIGYWQDPDLTQTQFQPDPEGGDKRIYLTGDFGRMSQDGCLEHLGRRESFAKVRGYRVETVEVELNLLSYPRVKQAAVVTHQTRSGDGRLVAYIVPANQPGPSASELRDFLRKKLPEYMIPSAFVLLDAMPLTTTGKVDRRSLPEPKSSRPEFDAAFVAPRTPTERRLAEIWAEVLGVDPIGIHDGFFDLGGDSLIATRILSRIQDALELEFSLSQLFEAPTVAALSAYIENAGQRKDQRSLVASPALIDGELLPSFAQQRLWFLDQLEPGGFTYNLFSAFRVDGELNAVALEQSLNELIRRHESLRTTFYAVDGQPFQRVLPSVKIQLPVIDLSGAASDRQKKSEVRRLSMAEARRPFDLARGPLLRAVVLRLADDEHRLLLNLHHIVFDAWSKAIFASELASSYEASARGRSPTLPPLALQYADFARWQRRSAQGESFQTQLAYWRKKLAGLATLRLPTERPRPGLASAHGARRYFRISKRLSAALRSLSRRHEATLFMTLLASYQTLLHRYTGQDDVAVGTPTAGRNHSGVESLIGCFLNMLVLRTDLAGNPTFRDLLARVRETCLEAYAHHDVPFEKLVEELQPERDLSQNPLFQVTFAFQNAPTSPLNLAGSTTKELDIDPGTARFDLHLFLEEEDSGLRGYVNYNADLFSAEMMARMIRHFEILLEGIVANPDERIGNLPLLAPAERHQLLLEWNDTRRDYPEDSCIHELFQAQAERAPEAVAVVFREQRLTYRELNRRANQLARYLVGLGVGPEVPVGLCLERSFEMVVGLLAILKAGGNYVPLDPAYPKERLAFMLQDVRAPVLLTQSKLLSHRVQSVASVVCLDTDWEVIACQSEENPVAGVTPENLAYVIYTSGSTGQPKGVAIAHRSAVSLLHWARSVFTAEELAGVLASTSICFDLSAFELFAPLSRGGKIILAENVLELPGLPAAHEVTLLNTVPSACSELLRMGTAPASVRAVNLAGEPLRTDLVRQIYRQLGVERVLDLYGPSEDTTYSTCSTRSPAGPATIGRPIANTQIYLLDPHWQPVPIGIPGELYIGGEGLARGYFNRPDLTAEKFIPHPFSTDPGKRLYRTGDRARYLPDGNIEFLGRIDHQVKIRGFRIEPGEVESSLSRHPAVREAVVVVHEDGAGEAAPAPGKQLVGYIVADQSLTTTELRDFLSQQLPEYMIPACFVSLDALPLTPNGKVDRKALPVPTQARPELQQTFVAPRTVVEKQLAEIWAALLKVGRIGIHDNFFDLGGHSLLATQVVSRTREAFDVELSLRSLFEEPTVAGLALQIARAQTTATNAQQVAEILSHVESLSDDEAMRLVAR